MAIYKQCVEDTLHGKFVPVVALDQRVSHCLLLRRSRRDCDFDCNEISLKAILFG